MRISWRIGEAGVLLFALLAVGFLSAAAAPSRNLDVRGAQRRDLNLPRSAPSNLLKIRMQRVSFDPLVESPNLPGPLRSLDLAPAEWSGKYYLLQLTGPVEDSHKALISNTGAELLEYLPEFAFVARIAPDRLEAVSNLPVVRWVGPFQPSYRISQNLDAFIGSMDQLVVQLRVFPGEDVGVLAEAFSNLGGEILEQVPPKADRSGYIRLSARGAILPEVAKADGIAWLEKYVEPQLTDRTPEPQNDKGSDVMGVNSLRQSKGYYGAGQLVAIADTGLDVGRDSTMTEASTVAGGSVKGGRADFNQMNGRDLTRVFTMTAIALEGSLPLTATVETRVVGADGTPTVVSSPGDVEAETVVTTTAVNGDQLLFTIPLGEATSPLTMPLTTPATGGNAIPETSSYPGEPPGAASPTTDSIEGGDGMTSPEQKIPPSSDSNEESAAPAALPDLIVYDIWITTGSLVENQTYRLVFELRNVGGGNATQTFYTNLFIGGQYVAQWYTPGGLGAGSYSKGQGDFATRPAGTWEVKMITDSKGNIAESNESNNTRSEWWTWQPSARPDLTVLDIWTPTNPLVEGQSYHLLYDIKNIGAADATQTFYIDLHIGGQYVQRWQSTGGLRAGWTGRGEGDYTTRPAGSWEVKITADSTGVIAESNESNNVRAETWTWQASARPDLTAIDVWSTTNPLLEGQPYHLLFDVKNIGSSDATQTFYIDLHIGGQYVQRWQSTGGLRSGWTARGEGDYTTRPAGSWEVRISVDSTGIISEANENNNVRAETWTWQPSALPDLTVLDIWSTTNPLVEGQPYHLLFDIKNIGSVDATQTFYIDLHVGGQYVQRWQSVGGLKVGWTARGEGDFTAPQAGSVEIKIVADSTNVIRESNDSNNERKETWTVNPPGPSDMHPDIRGRIQKAYALGRSGNWSDTHGHGTHVTGSVLGNGSQSSSDAAAHRYDGSFAGVAPEARVVFQSIADAQGRLIGIPSDLNNLFLAPYNDGARIHTNSWGSSVNGAYTISSRQVDEFVWGRPDMLILFSAGNSGNDGNANGVVDLDSMGAPATAKNLLAIGATENDRPNPSGGLRATWGQTWSSNYPADPIRSDYVSNNPTGLAAFSSRGPADDGRLKPDLVAPGTNVVSPRSQVGTSPLWGTHSNTWYAYSGGTSMSAPLAAGTAALLRQHLTTALGATSPSAALMRGFLINGATDISPGQYGSGGFREIPAQRPNNVAGWGRINIAEAIAPSGRTLWFEDRKSGFRTNDEAIYAFRIAAGGALRVALVWSDYPAFEGSAQQLVNDLDLVVTDPSGATVYPNGGSGPDRLNPTETVYISGGQAGIYRVSVRGRNVPQGPQPWALVVVGTDLTASRPTDFGKITPANGATGIPINPTLSWQSSAGAASYDYCVDTSNNNSCDTSWTTVDGNTSVALSGLGKNTTYYWQARARNAVGTTEADSGSWWSFTTIPDPPVGFAKTSPADGATDQPLSLSLGWQSSSGAASYEYCVDTINNNGCDADWQSAGSNTSAAISGLSYSTTYYWQARAKNLGGVTEANNGNWWSFSTRAPAPGPFAKSTPPNGAALQAGVPIFLTWAASSGATSYQYCLDTTDNSGCDGNWTGVGSNTSANPSGLSNGTYYWQVRAPNTTGATEADAGTWWNFTIRPDLPPTFSKIAPANVAIDQQLSLTLSWGSSVADSYEYCVDTTNNNSCDEAWSSTGSNTSVTKSGLARGTTYYWQARARNAAGTTEANNGNWWSFTTIPNPPGAFSHTAPANGATGQATQLNLAWTSSSGAATYEYCVDTTNNGTCDVSWSSAHSNTSVAISGLSPSTTYYWHVRAGNAGGSTEASPGWWSFATGQTAQTALFVDPPLRTATVGVPFTVAVAIADVTGLGSFQFTVAYSPTKVTVRSVTLGGFPPSTGRTFTPLGPTIDNTAGTARFGAYSLGATPAGPSGTGALALIQMQPQSAGSSPLRLSESQVTNVSGDPISVTTRDGAVSVTSCVGDFDGDGRVTIRDVQVIASRWGIERGNPSYEEKYDLDGNGRIDTGDIQRVASRWGEVCAAGQEAPEDASQMGIQTVTVISVHPPTQTVAVGQTFTTAIAIADAVDLGAFEFTLGYSPTIVEVIAASIGDFPGSSGRTVTPLGPIIDRPSGKVTFGAYSLGTDPPGPDGSGTVAVLILKALTPGETRLAFDQVQVTDRMGNTQSVTKQDGRLVVRSQGLYAIFLPAIMRE